MLICRWRADKEDQMTDTELIDEQLEEGDELAAAEHSR